MSRKNTLNVVNVRHGQQVTFSADDEQQQRSASKHYHEMFGRQSSRQHGSAVMQHQYPSNALPDVGANVHNSLQILPNAFQQHKNLSPSPAARSDNASGHLRFQEGIDSVPQVNQSIDAVNMQRQGHRYVSKKTRNNGHNYTMP